MAITRYNFEGGTDGANLAVGGGITGVSGSPPKYRTSAAFGGSALGVQSVGAQWARWAAPATDWSGSLYLRIKVNPGTGSQRIIHFRTVTDLDGGAVRFSSNGTIQIVNQNNTLVGANATTTWAVNDQFRLDWQSDNTGADVVLSLRIFKNANINGTTPDETLVRTITLNDQAAVRLGGITAGTWEVEFDNLALSNVLEWIGPASSVLETTGTVASGATVAGVASKVLNTAGTANGEAATVGQVTAVLNTAGTANGEAAAVGEVATVLNTVGTADGEATVAGIASEILNTVGTAIGEAFVDGLFGAYADVTGSAVGEATVIGESATLAVTTGEAEGVSTVDGQGGKVLSTVGTVRIEGEAQTPAPVFKPIYIFE